MRKLVVLVVLVFASGCASAPTRFFGARVTMLGTNAEFFDASRTMGVFTADYSVEVIGGRACVVHGRRGNEGFRVLNQSSWDVTDSVRGTFLSMIEPLNDRAKKADRKERDYCINNGQRRTFRLTTNLRTPTGGTYQLLILQPELVDQYGQLLAEVEFRRGILRTTPRLAIRASNSR
jgi:hypothetical protein